MASAIIAPVDTFDEGNIIHLANARAGQLRDARGYRRPKQCLPGAVPKYKHNPCKGRRYPPDPPTNEEIVRFLAAAPDTRAGRRFAALVVVLWQTGMRVSEGLDLEEADLDERASTIVIRNGKGGKRRVVGMTPWGWQQIRPYLEERRRLPAGKLFCVLEGPTAYRRAWNRSDVNKTFRETEIRADIRRRMAPHQLRHKFTLEWVRRGVPLPKLMKQLGHASLQVTTIYVMSLPDEEVFDVSRTAPVPMMAIPDLVRAPELAAAA